MELKNYQKRVLKNISSFMDKLNEENNICKAWSKYWLEQDIEVGSLKVPYYNNVVKGVPQVCLKVPTGGGKTFIACAAIKKIFDKMPSIKTKAIVWLVPSDPILEQTIKCLSQANHPYRQRINTDFGGKVNIYTKEMLLNGQNFSPDIIHESLSICILSYDSFRTKTKDGRRAFKENGYLKSFTNYFNDKENNLEDIPETALIQTLRNLEPVIIVDESHNATSSLSIEMLENFNPSFILELTATPREQSNIISYVDARELKTENMVKLPVIVYNRNSVLDVMRDSIQLRCSLEKIANQQANYIRPIVLFQAQPKTNEDNVTFEKIKKKLLDAGIPEEEIAIKTSGINEIKEDLLNKDCKIRYIITVNALKEGWDCPFAYILASLANKTSTVDVEQILGRILRQPHTQKYSNPLLNTSYVFTNSNDFHTTLTNIVEALNKSGFSKKDYRIGEDKLIEQDETQQLNIIKNTPKNDTEVNDEIINNDNDDIDDVDTTTLKQAIDNTNNTQEADSVNTMIKQAVAQTEEYDNELQAEKLNIFDGGEYSEMKNQNLVQKQFLNDIENIKLPQFFLKSQSGLFGGTYTILEPEHLSEGFMLSEQDAKLKFDLSTGEIYKIDIEENGEAIPKYSKISALDSKFLRDSIKHKPKEEKIKSIAEGLANVINRSDRYLTSDVTKYVNRMIENLSEDEIAALELSLPSYAIRIKEKIDRLEKTYREDLFYKWIDNDKIICQESYVLPKFITPLSVTEAIPLTLYAGEKNDLNGLENKIIDSIVSLENIRWWHRIIERNDFCINGYINHYPDFMVMTNSGKLILVEAKGDDRDNSDSKMKLKLGRKWQALAGNKYRYFMVFENQELNEEGAYTIENFINVLKEL